MSFICWREREREREGKREEDVKEKKEKGCRATGKRQSCHATKKKTSTKEARFPNNADRKEEKKKTEELPHST